MSDADLEFISKYCVSLGYINIKGCISVTDVCISNLIRRCIKLQSIIVCDTSFGVYSIQALCSEVPYCNSSALCGKRNFNTLASNLQMLHMACCNGEYYFLFSFFLFRQIYWDGTLNCLQRTETGLAVPRLQPNYGELILIVRFLPRYFVLWILMAKGNEYGF